MASADDPKQESSSASPEITPVRRRDAESGSKPLREGVDETAMRGPEVESFRKMRRQEVTPEESLGPPNSFEMIVKTVDDEAKRLGIPKDNPVYAGLKAIFSLMSKYAGVIGSYMSMFSGDSFVESLDKDEKNKDAKLTDAEIKEVKDQWKREIDKTPLSEAETKDIGEGEASTRYVSRLLGIEQKGVTTAQTSDYKTLAARLKNSKDGEKNIYEPNESYEKLVGKPTIPRGTVVLFRKNMFSEEILVGYATGVGKEICFYDMQKKSVETFKFGGKMEGVKSDEAGDEGKDAGGDNSKKEDENEKAITLPPTEYTFMASFTPNFCTSFEDLDNRKEIGPGREESIFGYVAGARESLNLAEAQKTLLGRGLTFEAVISWLTNAKNFIDKAKIELEKVKGLPVYERVNFEIEKVSSQFCKIQAIVLFDWSADTAKKLASSVAAKVNALKIFAEKLMSENNQGRRDAQIESRILRRGPESPRIDE